MKLKVGQKQVVDTSFAGFSRPWMGMHTIDTVRRDAEKEGFTHEIQPKTDGDMVEIIVTSEAGRIVYTVDVARDVISGISFSDKGELRFEYLKEVDGKEWQFREPRRNLRFSILDFRLLLDTD
jgi:hypothetical protein